MARTDDIDIAQASCAVVCNGKNCRGPARERLCDALREEDIQVVTSRCLRVCHGPVVVLPIRGQWHVAERVRGKRSRADLLKALRRQRRKPIRDALVLGRAARRAVDRAQAASLTAVRS